MNDNEKNPNISPTVAGGWVRGSLPLGCQSCIRGAKVVLFMGGDCLNPPHCMWYCPISKNRKPASAYYADELQIADYESLDAIIDTVKFEAKKISAEGMSITGGDPLSTSNKIALTCNVIRLMKVELGKDFHIHLYTSGRNFNDNIASQLDAAGLDELRFHPAPEDFHRLEFAAGRSFAFGGEVPVIPTEEGLQYMLDFADYLVLIGGQFLNLNEFEVCEPNRKALMTRGFRRVDESIATIQGSRVYAERFLREFGVDRGLHIHFCPVALKDGVQIRNRFIRRAENIRKPFETISEDGSLTYLQIEGGVAELKKLHQVLKDDSGVPENMMEVNLTEGKILLPDFLTEEDDFLHLLEEFHIKAGVVEIMPFHDPKYGKMLEYLPIFNKLRF